MGGKSKVTQGCMVTQGFKPRSSGSPKGVTSTLSLVLGYLDFKAPSNIHYPPHTPQKK